MTKQIKEMSKSDLEFAVAEQCSIALKLGATLEEAVNYEDIQPYLIELIRNLISDYDVMIEFEQLKREWNAFLKQHPIEPIQ